MLKLKIDHFRTVNDFEYDFPKGVTVIKGEQGSAKSTILQAFARAIIGKVPVNRDLNCLRVDEYESGRKHYIKVEGDGFSIDTDWNTHLNVNGEKAEIEKEWFRFLGLPSTQAALEMFTSKIFLTPFSPSLVEYKKTARANLLLSLFGVGFISNAIKYGRDRLGELTREQTKLIAVTDTGLPDVRGVDELRDKADALKARLKGVWEIKEIEMAKKQVDQIKSDLAQTETRFQANIKNLNDQLAKENEDEIKKKYSAKINAINEKSKGLGVTIGLRKLSRDYQLEKLEEQQRLLSRKSEFVKEEANLKSQLEDAQSYKCLACGTEARLQVVDGVVADFDYQQVFERQFSLKNNIVEITKELKVVEEEIDACKILDEYEALVKERDKIKEKRDSELGNITYARNILLGEIDKTNKEHAARTVELKTRLSDLLKGIEVGERNIENYKLLDATIEELSVAEKVRSAKDKVDAANARLKIIEPDINDLGFLVNKGFARWRTDVILEKCAYFELVVNDILEKFEADGRCEFIPKLNDSGDVVDIEIRQHNNGRVAYFYSLNSGERELIKTAIAIAQSIAHPQPIDKLGLLCIDEVLALLDSHHKEAVARYLNSLDRAVIVTTNDENAASYFNTDSVINTRMGSDGYTIIT